MNTPTQAGPGYWSDDVESSEVAQLGLFTHISPWRKIVLWTVACYLILNTGFEMVRIPPTGAGIPIGELVLVISLCCINVPTVLSRIASQVWLLPILVWWGYSFTRCLWDLQVGGAWSFRDASQAIESLFLIVGFWLVNSPSNIQYFVRWMRRLFWVAICYGLLFPIAPRLQSFSPKLPGMTSTSSAGLFFQMVNTPELMLWAACWLLIDRKSSGFVRGRELMAGFLVAYAAAFGQSRTIYLGVLTVGVLFFVTGSRLAARWTALLLLGVLMIGAISVSGVEIKGRLGQKISLDFIVNHFEAITGKSSDEATESAAGGVPLRIGWWTSIYKKMIQSPEKIAFGLGYGIPLTDFHGNSAIIREPHNSYISVVARLGVTGMFVWLLMQGALFLSWRRAYRFAGQMGWDEDRGNLLLLLVFNILVLTTAIGEDALEKPFYAIPYYLFWGIVLRYGREMRESAAAQFDALPVEALPEESAIG
jgi:O-antigen ligase